MDLSEGKSVEPGKWRQFTATVIINLSSLTYGVTLGWASPVIPDLEAGKTPVSASAMTAEQISWLVGIVCFGAALVLPLCSGLTERLGRKRTGYVMILPFFICWILTAFAPNYTYLLMARFFVGIGGAMCLFLVPIYVSEISADTIRGQLGSILILAFNLGMLLGYILGAVLSYTVFAVSALAIPIIFVVGFFFMPETPVYLVRKGEIIEATKSLMWLKNNDKSAVDEELQCLRAQAAEKAKDSNTVGIKDLCRDRATIRGLVISLGLLSAQATCGLFVVLTYTSTIFKLAGSSLSPNAATIVVGVVQVFGSWLSTMTIEKAGRRVLLLISTAGMVISHCILGIFFLLQHVGHNVTSIGWIPLVALSVYMIAYFLGAGPVPYIIVAEVFSADISGLASSVCQISMWMMAFPIIKFFPLVAELLGVHICFFIFAALCACTLVFTYLLVPETKGRTVESILDELNGVYWNLGQKKTVTL